MLRNAGGTGTIYEVFAVLIQGNLNPFKDKKWKGGGDDVPPPPQKKIVNFFFRVIVIELKIGYRHILINVENL